VSSFQHVELNSIIGVDMVLLLPTPYRFCNTVSKLCTIQTTSMSVLLTVGPKCTLATSHTAPWWSYGEYAMPTGQTDRQTDGRQTVTLCFPIHVAGIIIRPTSSHWGEGLSSLQGVYWLLHFHTLAPNFYFASPKTRLDSLCNRCVPLLAL